MNASPPLTGAELKQYRLRHDLSLREMGEKLGGKSPTTIKRWEDGDGEDAEIPGNTQMLLKLLIRGEMPFGAECGAGSPLRSALMELEMQLGAFEKLSALAVAGGYSNIIEYIGALVQQHLASEETHARKAGRADLAEVALLAEKPPEYVTGSKEGAAVTEPLKAAAAAWLAAEEPSVKASGRGHTAAGSTRTGKPGTKPAGTQEGRKSRF